MKVLITGSTGFVGQHLIKYLTESSIDCKSISREQLYRGELPGASTGDSLIHLAGKAHDLREYSNPAEYYKVNFELTKVLYDAFLNSDANKFIFISSVKASADSVNRPLTEDHIPDPKTDYGHSKLLAEQYIQNQPLPSGKSYFILRPCMIHGPGNRGNLNLLYHFVSYNVPYVLDAFQNQRSFLSIENLCFSIKEFILREDIPSGIFNVADSEPLSTSEIVRLIGSVRGRKVRLWKINKQFICKLAEIGDNLGLPLTTERLTKLTENYIVNNRKICAAFKKELPVSAVQGMTRTISSFKKF
jgi:nucleoside-diphosphate-sugar epimerase